MHSADAVKYGVGVWMLVGLCCSLSCQRSSEAMATWTPQDHSQLQRDSVPNSNQSPAQPSDTQPQESGDRVANVVWMLRCASCHGAEGRGDGAQKPPAANVRDLSDPEWQKTRTDAEIIEVIRKGRGMMPAFGEQLGEAGLQSLLAKVRSFKE